MNFKTGQDVAVYVNDSFEEIGIIEIAAVSFFYVRFNASAAFWYRANELKTLEDHEDCQNELAYENYLSDYYGGSRGMSDQEKFELSRDCGRKI